jgi:hypothetical protein
VAGLWFSPGPPVSSTNKTDRHDKTVIFMKVALNTIKVHLALIEIRTHNISGDTITATMAPRVKVNLNVDEIDDEKISSSSESRQIINNFQVCYTKPLIINMQFFSCITERTSYIR